jgi:hypothetical protein
MLNMLIQIYKIYTGPLSVQAQYCRLRLISSSFRCNGSLVTWTTVCLTAAKFKPLIISVSVFALSNIANILVIMPNNWLCPFLIASRHGPRRDIQFPTVTLFLRGYSLAQKRIYWAVAQKKAIVIESPLNNGSIRYIAPSLKLFVPNGLQVYCLLLSSFRGRSCGVKMAAANCCVWLSRTQLLAVRG